MTHAAVVPASNAAFAADEKSLPAKDAIKRTVQSVPDLHTGPVGTWTMALATVADDIIPWGALNPWKRDQQLREFWPSEPILAGAMRSVALSYATFSWTLDGPPRTANAAQDMLHAANLGRGWLDWAFKTIVDLKTQDNGAFTELIRERDSESAPVLGINHLDASRCQRTGDPRVPVLYTDREGARHKLKWYQVITWEDLPSPIEVMNGMQYSSLTCVLRAAQILRDISIYKREKIGARGPSSIHLVSGVGQQRLDDAEARGHEKADNLGLLRYMHPTIIASLDPTAEVSHVEIPVKSLPDGFDADIELKWYITELALGFGQDYQDFAPLPGGNLGTSQQSEILHLKSRGKGPGVWMKLVEHKFNFHGVLPKSTTFRYDEKDAASEREAAATRKAKADVYAAYISQLQMPAQVVWQMMVDEGELKQEYFDMLGQQDRTANVLVTDAAQFQEPGAVVAGALPGQVPANGQPVPPQSAAMPGQAPARPGGWFGLAAQKAKRAPKGTHRGHTAPSGKPHQGHPGEGGGGSFTTTKHGATSIRLQAGLDESQQVLTPEFVAAALDEIPESHRAVVKEIRITDQAFVADDGAAHSNYAATYYADTGAIEFHANAHLAESVADLEGYLAGTVRHEAAHVLEDSLGQAFWDDWARAMQAEPDFISEYARAGGLHEDIAETIRHWWSPDRIERATVERFFPERAAVLEKYGVELGGAVPAPAPATEAGANEQD